MPKINREEYEILKSLDEKWKWVARDEDRGLYAFTEKPVRKDGPSPYWDTETEGPYTALELIDEIHLFQFIQWEDEEPYNIAELIEEYEDSKEYKDSLVIEYFMDKAKESEETEVKTLESIREEIWEEMKRLEDDRKYRGSDVKYQTLREVLQKLGHLDEPEVLSQEWIDENKSLINGRSINPDGTEGDCHDAHYIHVLELQNLLVPKQALPAIPKFVAEFLIGKEDYMLYELLDDEWLYKEHNRVAKWLYDNDELTNKQREIDLVMARDRGYVVEEEQKYRVIDSHKVYLLAKEEDRNEVETVAKFVEIYGYDHAELDYNLTEQEIKDYDPRFWPFAVRVEELEE